MVLRVRCPNPKCGKRYKVDKSLRGQRTVCKACGQQFTITAAAGDTLAAGGPAETLRPEGSDRATPGDVPSKLGRFEIRARIGSGAFGTVYRAHDPVLDREVALKVPRAAVLEKPQARARFLREPKAAAQLRHPHIVPVYDAGTDGEHYYIASAYIEGRTLEEVIGQGRPDFRTAARIVADLAAASDYAHRMGVVHRDIKPANVMMDERGQAMLMDFGLARLESAEEKLTQDGSLMGTPAYMAPEQADGSFGEVGPASDQYALGVVLYELLCGEPPFSGPPAVLIYNLTHQDPPLPRRANADVPRDLGTIALKAMCKRPGARYADCGVMADDLRRWLADAPIAARPLGPMERFGRWCRRNPTVAILSTFSFVLLLLVAVVASVGFIQTGRALKRARDASQLAEARRSEAETAERRQASLRQEAESLRQKAEEALSREREQRQLADAARKAAEDARDELMREQKKTEAAEQARGLAEQQAEGARLGIRVQEYGDLLTEAYRRASEGLGRYDLLNSCPHDLRHWEWRYLMAGCMTMTQEVANPYLFEAKTRTDDGSGATCLAFSGAGTLLAAAAGSGIWVRDVNTGEDLAVLRFPGQLNPPSPTPSAERDARMAARASARGIAFAPDNTRLASLHMRPYDRWEPENTDRDVLGVISVWDIGSEQELSRFPFGYSDDMQSGAVTFEMRPDFIILGNRRFDPSTGKEIAASAPPREPDPVDSASPGITYLLRGLPDRALSRDGKRLVTVEGNGTRITIWGTKTDMRSGGGRIPLLTLDTGGEEVRYVALSPDGMRMATTGSYGSFRIWKGVHPRLTYGFPGKGPMAFSPDARELAFGRGDEERAAARSRRALSRGDSQFLRCDAQSGAIQHMNGKGYSHMRDSGRSVGTRNLGIGFAQEGKAVWEARQQDDSLCQMTIRQRPGGLWLETVGVGEQPGKRGRAELSAFSQDGRVIVVPTKVWTPGRPSDELAIWDGKTGELLGAVRPTETGTIVSVAVSAEGKCIAALQTRADAPEDPNARLYVWRDRQEAFQCAFPEATRSPPLVFAAEGSRLAGGGKGVVKIWDTTSRDEVSALDIGNADASSLAFGPNTTRLAIGDSNGKLSVWNLSTGKRELGPFDAASAGCSVTCVAFSPDGKLAAAAGGWVAAKAWSVNARLVTEESQMPRWGFRSRRVRGSRPGERTMEERTQQPREWVSIWDVARK